MTTLPFFPAFFLSLPLPAAVVDHATRQIISAPWGRRGCEHVPAISEKALFTGHV